MKLFVAFAIALSSFAGFTRVAEAATCGAFQVSGLSVSRVCSSTQPQGNQHRTKVVCWVDNFPQAPSNFNRYGSWVYAGQSSGASCYLAGFRTGVWDYSTQFRTV